MFSKRNNSTKDLLPFYVKGCLNDDEKNAVEKAILEEENLKKELKDWQIIKQFLTDETITPEPSQWLFTRIKARIKTKPSTKNKYISALVMGLQTFIIISLLFYIFEIKAEYRTLSSSTKTLTESKWKINIVFKDSTTERQIRKILNSIDGKIVDGPSVSGLYVIAVSSQSQLEDALDKLKNENSVVIAEKAY